MNLATDDGHLNLAGALMFAERPEWIVPQFVVKAFKIILLTPLATIQNKNAY